MPDDPMLRTTFRDVLDPLSGRRHDVALGGGRRLSPDGAGRSRDVDGSSMLLLPGLYDADAHMPLLLVGPRRYDLFAALWGGVQQMNVALPWQLLGSTALADVVAETAPIRLPRLTLLLSVSPTPESEGFAAWLQHHRDEVTEILPPLVKLYTADPHFDRNLDAVWDAGLTPVVFSYTPEDLERLLARAHAPIHFRHATSGPMVSAMRAVTGSTVQTSPHFLLPLADEHRERLVVLPTPPDAADRASLASVFVSEVDVIASDHVSPAPYPPAGPGLQTQQHFLHALVAAAAHYDWELSAVLAKATTAPAEVFRRPHLDGFVVFDPTVDDPTATFPKQSPERAPYLGVGLPGRVVAIGCEDRAVVL